LEAIKTSKKRIEKQLDELWHYAQKVAAAELPDKDPTGFDKNADKIAQTIEHIIEALKDKPVSKEDSITVDAGHGSEQNYQYLCDNKIENYVKYNYFDNCTSIHNKYKTC